MWVELNRGHKYLTRGSKVVTLEGCKFAIKFCHSETSSIYQIFVEVSSLKFVSNQLS